MTEAATEAKLSASPLAGAEPFAGDAPRPALAAQGLGFRYRPGAWILRGLDLSFRRGGVHAVLGLNGCGKTTLLRLLLGVLKPQEGRVEKNGPLAFVPQLFQAVFSFTALDMVLMGRARHIGLFSSPSRRDEKLALEALARFGLAHLAPRPFAELSGGQRQLVILARALASEAQTLVLDEPASALDLANQALLVRRLKSLSRDDGLTIIFTTHMPQQALAVAEDVLMMTPGGCWSGPVNEVMTEENLARAYGAEVRLVEFERGGKKSRALVSLFVED
ncbi:MAG: ABC transporter ATP-binding protein [Deltaproteobacteria bacterium]|jgi:iron complex transport system ATP-binding protein|nr:ABC transporter ATP-binding protein [Deltaproteobacteria bacterium]